VLLNRFPQSLKILADLYFRAGHLKLTSAAVYELFNSSNPSASSLFSAYGESSPFATGDKMPPSHLTNHQEAIVQIFAAAQLNHKRARFVLAIILENGMLPSASALKKATGDDARYNFLNFVVDIKKSVLFKYLDESADRSAFSLLSEFEADTKAQAISNLYLSSQIS